MNRDQWRIHTPEERQEAQQKAEKVLESFDRLSGHELLRQCETMLGHSLQRDAPAQPQTIADIQAAIIEQIHNDCTTPEMTCKYQPSSIQFPS